MAPAARPVKHSVEKSLGKLRVYLRLYQISVLIISISAADKFIY